MQITQWGPWPQGPLDYAVKEWSGLVSGYFSVRWEVFSSYLVEIMQHGVPYSEQEVQLRINHQAENPFAYNVDERYPTEPSGQSIQY